MEDNEAENIVDQVYAQVPPPSVPENVQVRTSQEAVSSAPPAMTVPPIAPAPPTFHRSPTLEVALVFNNKVHKMYYNQGIEVAYEGYDVNIERRHTFLIFITIKSKRFQ